MPTAKCLPIALCLLTLAACSTPHVTAATPPLPANLSSPCPPIPPLPDPMIDPVRLGWELDLMRAHADCAAKHAATVKAWPKENN